MRPSILVLLMSLALPGVLAAFALAGAASGIQVRIAPSPRTGKEAPVMVELFTSEGCSSCPPADDLLTEIHKAHYIANAEVFVLSEHVDYWNRLGWVDPFSSAQFSDRQKAYAARFGQSGIYTPQMVVDGREELVGSDRSHALRAIADAARQPKATVVLALAHGRPPGDGNPVRLAVRVERLLGTPPNNPAGVFLAVTESGLHSQVMRGENAGRKLDHTAVVRKLMDLGHTDPKTGGFTAMAEVFMDAGWNREQLRVIVFVQAAGCGPVLGSTALSLAEPSTGTKDPKAPL
jgi:hypothetical protein